MDIDLNILQIMNDRMMWFIYNYSTSNISDTTTETLLGNLLKITSSRETSLKKELLGNDT